MVAVTTHPDFVSAMHRACAIVTDEGGLTSHAAIVSREFRIPCVVGTKNATFAFNDGDFIEVNASQGTVKKVTQ
jgi:pyruvate, water dikinase